MWLPLFPPQSSEGFACAMLAVYLDNASNVPVGALSGVLWSEVSADDVLMWVLVFASRKTRMKSTSRTKKEKGR